MCILVLKKKGVCFPSPAIVKRCMEANPHGFSLSYNANGKVVTYKTLDARKFIEEYKMLATTLDREDTAMMLHMRIATHGSIGVANCHGWKGNILGTEVAFAHNGILRIPNRDDMTDSETFLRDYLEPCKSFTEASEVISKHIGQSKFGFIDGDGNIAHFGDFQTYCGVMYSNGSYRASRFSHSEADPRLWRMVV